MTVPILSSSKYPAFEKIPRFHRDITITEKIDGTNGLISIDQKIFGESAGWDDWPSDMTAVVMGADLDETGLPGTEYWVRAGSRNRWIRDGEPDNAGFREWVEGRARSLVQDLGPGLHYGEWYGQGINRRYGLDHKRFALFNTKRWTDKYMLDDFTTPNLEVVPILWDGPASIINVAVTACLDELREMGSLVAPGFMRPEGIAIFHSTMGYSKVTLEKDEAPKAFALKAA